MTGPSGAAASLARAMIAVVAVGEIAKSCREARMTPESFADHPESVTEIKSDIANNLSILTPRDVLIRALRAIDSGEESPDSLVLIWAKHNPDGDVETHYDASVPHLTMAIGLLGVASYKIQRSSEDD